MTPAGNSDFNIPPITAIDLQDPNLGKLNRNFSLLASQLAAVQGVGGFSQFTDVRAKVFSVPDATIPADDNDLLSLGAAKTLFNPSIQRQAFLSGKWFGTTVAPLPQAGTTTVSSSTIIEADSFCGGMGLSEACINAAIAAAPAAGAAIHCKAGIWKIGGPIMGNKSNIRIYGDGDATILKMDNTVTFTGGMFQITAGPFQVDSLLIDGSITSSTRIDFSTLFGAMGNDPMHPTLTNNSPIYISNGASSISVFSLTVQNCGGYGAVVDARSANCVGIYITDNFFLNNIAWTFGDSTYGGCGSYTGGVLIHGGCGTGYDGTVYGNFGSTTVRVENNQFQNITGICGWMHAYGFTVLSKDVTFNYNKAVDIGRDVFEPGAVDGFQVMVNTASRVGYIAGHPKYYPGQGPVGYDCTGYAINGSFIGNIVSSVNGYGMNLDGTSRSTIAGNTITVPDPSDPAYTTDEVANYGFSGSGNITKGIETGNTYNPDGANHLVITANVIRGMGNLSISLVNAQSCFVTGNTIDHPATAIDAPIGIACSGTNPAWTSPPRFCKDNTVTSNKIHYDVSGQQYCIYETDTLGINVGPNFVGSNDISGSNKGEFLPSANGLAAGTNTGLQFATISAGSGTSQAQLAKTLLRREGLATIVGTCNTSGTGATGAVTGTGGTSFTSGLVGTALTINGIPYMVTVFTDATHVTVSPGPGTQTGVSYKGSDNSASKFYSVDLSGGPSPSLLAITDSDALLQVSVNGQQYSGRVALGNRSTFGFLRDYVFAGKTIVDGYHVLGRYNLSTTYFDGEANTLDDSYGLFKYERAGSVGTGGTMYMSVATSGGSRTWIPVGTASGAVAGSDTQVQINKSGAFYADGNLTFDWRSTGATPQLLTVTGIAAKPTIAVANGFIQADGGFLVPNINSAPFNNSDVIQAKAGGVTVRYLIGLTSMTIAADTSANAGLSGSGQGRIYFDSTLNKFLASENTGAYVPLVSTTSVAGAAKQVQYHDPSTAAFAASPNFIYDPTLQRIEITGIASTAGIGVANGFVQADGGFVTSSSSGMAIQAPAGGVTAAFLSATDSLIFVEEATLSALAPLGQARLYMDSSTHRVKISQNNTAYVDLLGAGSAAGSDKWVQFNTGGTSFDASANLQFDKTLQRLTVAGIAATAGIVVGPSGFIQSAEGFLSASAASTAVNIPSGGVTALSLISIRNDGASGVTIARTSATAQTYGLGVSSSGFLQINDDSVAAARIQIKTTGLTAIGTGFITDSALGPGPRPDILQLQAPSDATCAFQATNANAYSGFNVLDNSNNLAASFAYGNPGVGFLPNCFFIAIRNATGAIVFGTTSAILERMRITPSGEVQVTSGQVTLTPSGSPINTTNGAMRYDNGIQLFQFRQNGAWVGLGGGIPSVTGTNNQVLVNGTSGSPQTGAITVSLPSSLIISGLYNSSVSGLAFQAGGGFFQAFSSGLVNCASLSVNSNLTVSSAGALASNSGITINGNFVGNSTSSAYDTNFNTVGGFPYRLRGSGLINNNGVWVSPAGIDMPAGIGATSFNIHGGSFGQSGTVTAGGHTLTFTSGILTSFV